MGSAAMLFGSARCCLLAGILVYLLTPAAAAEPLVVFLVRHAEKVDAGTDPALTAAGKQRAQMLALLLQDAAIDALHSSGYVRTRDTAIPVAELLAKPVHIYNPDDLPALVDRLRTAGGRHLVVGHSNTTPALVTMLGGEPGAAINETSEYDRLYVVTVGAGGDVSTVLLRYGQRRRAP